VPEITWTDEFFPILLRPRFIPYDVKSVLDVGCGRGLLGALLRIYRDPEYIAGIDSHKPYLDFVKKMGTYNEILELDLGGRRLPFTDKRFDLVVCLEVIEHLRKEQGLHLIDELQRVGKRVILSTPGIFYEQKTYDGNPHQHHLSYYSVDELETRGFDVYGVGNLLVFGKPIKYISVALGKLTYLFPKLSDDILALKE